MTIYNEWAEMLTWHGRRGRERQVNSVEADACHSYQGLFAI